MTLLETNPFIRYARLHRSAGYTESRRCYDCRLFLFCEGDGNLECDGNDYSFSKGDAVFLPPGTTYRFLTSDSKNILFYVIDFDMTSDFSHLCESKRTPLTTDFDESGILHTPLPNGFENIRVFSVDLPAAQQLLSEICRLHLRAVQNCFVRSSALMKQVLCILVESENRKHEDLCSRVTEYIFRNFADPDLNNAAIAAAFGYHPYHLAVLFKTHTGKTLHGFLVAFRLSVAWDMLITTDLPVSEISWKCGFSSCSHFIKAFREKYGVTPGRVRS